MARIYHTWHGYAPDTAPPFVTDGLVGHWDAGDANSYPGSGTDWFDLTANSNDGTLVNGPAYSTTGGAHIEFDGDNDRMDLGSIDSSNPLSLASLPTFTLEFWINPDASGDDFQRFLDKGSSGVSVGGYGVLLRPSLGAVLLTINGSSTGTILPTYSGWSQVIIKREATNNIRFYQNASMFASGVDATAIPTTTATMRVGTWAALSGREYKGKIGCLRIYNKDLSPSEIQLNYDQIKGRYGLS